MCGNRKYLRGIGRMASEPDIKYKIGQSVSVRATVRFVRRGNERLFLSYKCDPFIAKVVGSSRKQIGAYCVCGGEGDDFYEEYFEQKDQIFVWKVIRGYYNKPLLVFPDDLKAIDYDYELPWVWKEPVIWSCKDREALREAVKTWERDSAGRFLKQL